MPRVGQAHLDARRQQIVDAARARFAVHGFARTSMADVVAESGLSIGAIYRYFSSKEELVTAVCEQADEAFPTELTAQSVGRFLEHVRTLAREQDHARLVAQIYAEAAVSPPLAAIVARQLAALRTAVAELVPEDRGSAADSIAEAFVAVGVGYNQQLAVRGDLDPAPFARALMTVIDGGST
jgi:TetR/AcrR family transcriptional regulator, transcriptional repressor of aconitase